MHWLGASTRRARFSHLRPGGRGIRLASSSLVVCGLVLTLALGDGVALGSAHHRHHKAHASVGKLLKPGSLTFCSDISSPPLEFYKDGKTATGSDINIGNAIAHQLKLKPVWVNTTFSGIIPALQAGHCDLIMSQLFIKPSREKVVSFVHYMNSSEAIMVRKGNPLHISGLNDLCGRQVAAETGTTVATFLTAASKKCTKRGKPAINVQTFLRDSDAVEQLGLGHVDAYGTTLETGSYDISKNKGEYQFAGKPFDRVPTGIAMRKNDPQLRKAVAQAFAKIRRNGTYKKIMTKWGIKGDMVK